MNLGMILTHKLVLLILFYDCNANDDNLVPLSFTCTSSVQCLGIAVCIENRCRCPEFYIVFGNSCIPGNNHSNLTSSFSLDSYTYEEEIDDHNSSDYILIPPIYENLVPTATPSITRGTTPDIPKSAMPSIPQPTITNILLGTTPFPLFSAYPGQKCGYSIQCTGKSFCYRGVCSCHPGTIVSGRTCVPLTVGPKYTKGFVDSKPKIKISIKPKATTVYRELDVERACPEPLIWIDGNCVDPTEVDSSTPKGLGVGSKEDVVPKAFCKAPLIIIDGWCMLPKAEISASHDTIKAHNIQISSNSPCPLNTIWSNGRCTYPSLSHSNQQSHQNIPPTVPVSETSVMPISDQSIKRCPAGELLINSACLSTAFVVNYPSPILCTVEQDCPDGATCLSYVCVCTVPFTWNTKTGCDLPWSEGQDVKPLRHDLQDTKSKGLWSVLSGHDKSNRKIARLGKRCRHDSDCIEKAVCELGLCACRAPYIPFASMCVSSEK